MNAITPLSLRIVGRPTGPRGPAGLSPPDLNLGLQVGADNRTHDQYGRRIFLRGMQEFNNSFGEFDDGYRQNWYVRRSQKPGIVADFSPPILNTGGVPWLVSSYGSPDIARAKLLRHKLYGANTVRWWLGIGMLQTRPFTDAGSGLSFPSELQINDTLTQICAELGMYSWQTFAQGSVPNTDADAAAIGTVGSAVGFWTAMATRYKAYRNIIFEIENEAGSGSVYNDINNPLVTVPYSTVMKSAADWAARIGPCLTAIRNAGFRGPVAVSPYANLWHIDTILAQLQDPTLPFLNDPNLIVTVHPYYIHGNTATPFSTDKLSFNTFTFNYAQYFCVVAGESGFTPDFNFTDPTAALEWAEEMLPYFHQERFNGIINFTMQPQHDNLNDLIDETTQEPTAWGDIAFNYNLLGSKQLISMVPKINTVLGAFGDTSGSSVQFRRHDGPLKCDLAFKVCINQNGSAIGPMFLGLPMLAPTDRVQFFDAWTANGTQLRVKVEGGAATIKNLDGSYPGADGVVIYGQFTYDVQGPGAAVYNPFTFDGATRLLRGGTLTNVSDGQQGTLFFQMAMNGGDGLQQQIVTTSNSHLSLFRNAQNQINLQLRNSAGTLIGNMVSDYLPKAGVGTFFGLISWDLSRADPSPKIIMNVAGSSGIITTAVNDVVNYTELDLAIGGLVGGGNYLQADVDFIYFDPTFNDFTLNPPHGNFIDFKNDPVELGTYGMQALGTIPALFLRRTDDSVDPFWTNRGYGGGFTKTP